MVGSPDKEPFGASDARLNGKCFPRMKAAKGAACGQRQIDLFLLEVNPFKKLRRLIQKGSRMGIVPPFKALELYPPFLFMGVKIDHISKDFRNLVASMPTRWYSVNFHGSLFGGNMCSASDPLPALMCARIFDGVDVWTKANSVEFNKPAKGRIEMRIEISDSDVITIQNQLDSQGKAIHAFEFSYWDKSGNEIAKVKNTVYLKKMIASDS